MLPPALPQGIIFGDFAYFYVMKNVATLFALIASCSVFGQTNPNFNPDYDGNGFIGVDDILGVLGYFNTPWGDALSFSCGDEVSFQGYDYATVLIGEQCWFAENLRSENYANGDPIPSNLSDSEWGSTNSGAVAIFGEDAGCESLSPDINACDPSQSLSAYGRLYNWFAVDDDRGLCPSGWHIPTDEEWSAMTEHLGGEWVAGDQMKTNFGWYDSGNGSNASGFSGTPGGTRAVSGNFLVAGYHGNWWSSSSLGVSAWYRNLDYAYDSIYRDNASSRSGFSVRCIQDVE